MLKLFRATIGPGLGLSPGTIHLAEGRLLIATGDGTIDIQEIQQEGKRAMPVGEFLRGFTFDEGERLE